MKKLQHMAMLFDFYGRLLTDKQREILALYYEQDFSLGEIAEEFQVSRQAIHDVVKRSEKILEEYEHKLGLVHKFAVEQEKLSEVVHLVDSLEEDSQVAKKLRKLINEIRELQDT